MKVQPEQTRKLGEPLSVETFTVVSDYSSPTLQWFTEGLTREMLRHGHEFLEKPAPDIRLVMKVIDIANPQPYRRKAQATFVVAIVELPEPPDEIIPAGYPLLLHALANVAIFLIHTGDGLEAHFITMEQGHYTVPLDSGDDTFFAQIYERVEPLASSQLVINNVFRTDLEEELWNGDDMTEQIKRAGRRLDQMDLLPAPFPIDKLLKPKELRHVMRLAGIGGLSYGNLSARKDRNRYWMSASGVNKGKLDVIGKDILLVSGFDPETPAMILSVPPDIQPRRVSVDAIEHWMIYQEHPGVGAILHVHAWMDGIRSTEINFPCGTFQLANAVAELIRQEPDPSRAVIGLKNHGVTITGTSMDEIFERVGDKIIPQVPMS